MKEKNSAGYNENLVEMNHITKVFHKQRAIDQVSLCIPKNCVYGSRTQWGGEIDVTKMSDRNA